MNGDYILKVEGISKSFPGTKALSEVRIDVHAGEVHALVGENGAGKSTLMNIISGVFPPDEGKICFMGKDVIFGSPREAQNAGIGFVHQELALCQHISVAENLYMDNLPVKFMGIVDWKRLYKNTKRNLEPFKCDINPNDLIKTLNVGEQQIVEIAKSLSLNCKLLILDEPTSSLSETETQTLFRIIKQLKERGLGILYISHRMAEIFEVCDRVTVFRDGKFINTFNITETNPHQIVSCMVGRNLDNLYPHKSKNIGPVMLEVKGLTKKGVFRDINFSLRKGEILGITGLIGAGRTEVARAICAIDSKDEGEVYLEEKKVVFKDYGDAIKHGVCYLTEDRKHQGIFYNMNIKDNINAANVDGISNNLIVTQDRENELASEYVKKLNIKIVDLKQKMSSLSGGNQQKAMLARWLSVNPRLIFMDEPTRGIDVGAKSEIHNMLRDLANEGIGIVLISSELPEIIGMCDRVIVMHEGQVSGEVESEELSEKKLILLASGQ
ncbi:MAG: sugar ABC transporter ATP-binding protein [Clostridiaceae bacterium]|nr:sugar ABC transporter ATP-binding protein [Clostridiaceae bacterium]